MGLYLYCIGSAGHPPPPDLRGLDDVPVRGIEAVSFCVWTSEASRRPEVSLARIRRHDRVVRAAMRGPETPLPVRFGQWFPDAEALASRLVRRSADHRRALEAVAGCVEVAVQVVEDDGSAGRGRPAAGVGGAPRAPPRPRTSEPEVAAAPRSGSGRAYLEALARRSSAEREAERRGARVAADLEAHLGSLVRDQRTHPGRGDILLRVAHLVPRTDVEAHGRAVRAFGAGVPELRLRTSGPWPPYSFVA